MVAHGDPQSKMITVPLCLFGCAPEVKKLWVRTDGQRMTATPQQKQALGRKIRPTT
jgi:hypothetical protein